MTKSRSWWRRRRVSFAYRVAFYVAAFAWSIVFGWNVAQWLYK